MQQFILYIDLSSKTSEESVELSEGIVIAYGSERKGPFMDGNKPRRGRVDQCCLLCWLYGPGAGACQYRRQRPLSIVSVDDWYTLSLSIPYGIL